MDVRYINPFVSSICNTFGTMCGLHVEIGKPQLKTGDDHTSDVSGVIGFSGDAAGSVVLHFDLDVACKVATAFAQTEITPDHPDFADAIGELANMVAGGAKSKFEGLDINISLPNVIIGANHKVSACKSSPRLLFSCIAECGTFQVEIGMEMKKGAGAAGKPVTVGASS